MKRMVKAGLALGLSVCLTVSAVAAPPEVSAKKTVAPKKITLNKKAVPLNVGDTFKIKVKKVKPKKASKKISAFLFRSSKRKVASVSKKGVIKAKQAGSCTVTVTAKKNKKAKAVIKVTVAGNPDLKPPVATVAPTQSPVPASALPPVTNPTASPSTEPTAAPTGNPTAAPTGNPTAAPTGNPTAAPTGNPTAAPTGNPTAAPTGNPTAAPTGNPTAAPTGNPTAAPTATPTAAPTATPFNVTISPATQIEGGNADGIIYGDDGSVTYCTTRLYSGGGVGFSFKEDKSAVDLSKYTEIRITAACAGKNVGVTPVLLSDQTTEYSMESIEGWTTDSIYSSTPATANEEKEYVFHIDQSKISEINAKNPVGIMLKYNAYGLDGGDNDYKGEIFTIKSIRLVGTEEADTVDATISKNTQITKSTIAPVYDESGVTYCTNRLYSGGGAGFYIMQDKTSVDLTQYEEIRIKAVCQGTSVPVIVQVLSSEVQYGYPKAVLEKNDTTPATADEEKEYVLKIDQTKAAQMQAGAEDGKPIGVRLKYNAYGLTGDDKGEIFTIKSIQLIPKASQD